MIALLASPIARYLLGAAAALFALWLVYNVIDNRGYQRAATEYTLKIERIHAERAGSVCLNSFGRFAKWISATDYAAA
ncbi:hypothetical protein GOL82_16530, partial [Sinorhizobium medicae]|nr:hypothetical protein [Sinorhizobium medicae]